jgi:hypothetical protein
MKVSKLLLCLCLLATCPAILAESVPSPLDRGRVTVVSHPDPLGGGPLLVLRTDEGSPLRAGTAWIWSKQWMEEPPEYYAAMRGKGLNAVRVILFDTWEKEAGYGGGDWNDPVYRDTMLARLERAVNYASLNGLYVIINSHNKIPQYDVEYNAALWTKVAPYFRNRTHVLYEASNEPLEGTLINGDGVYSGSVEKLQTLRNHHDLIRTLAPDTHVMVLTPAGISGWGFEDGLARLTSRFEQLPGLPIDWSKTSVAYHLYHADENLFPQAQNLRTFHRRYPGWPSENNFPKTLTNEQLGITDSWRSPSYGSDVFMTQTTERLGLGWSHWNINRMDQLTRNFPFLWEDAVQKGYAWEPDPVVNELRFINAGGETVGSAHYDVNYLGGSIAANNPSGPVDTSLVPQPAPLAVYRSERWGDFKYQFARFPDRNPVKIRLHFIETWDGITAAGQRVFDVAVNGKTAISRLDIFATAGGRNRAIVREVAAVPDAKGRITLHFRPIQQNAKVDGIEVMPSGRRERRATPPGNGTQRPGAANRVPAGG